MSATDIVLIMSAIGTLLTTVVGAYIAITTRTIHKLVNQSTDDAKRHRAVLERVIQAAGIPLPVDQSVILEKDVK